MVDLKVYVVTFNCGRKLIEPDAFGRHLFDNWADPTSSSSGLPDVVVLNLQEIAPLGYAFLSSNLVKPYFDRFRKALDIAFQTSASRSRNEVGKYSNVLARNVGLTAIMLFVKEDLLDEIQTLNMAEVGVGLSRMGNKGAIGARIGWRLPEGETLLYTTFVSAHLAPFEAEIQRRDQDYVDIAKGLVFTKDDAREWRKDQTNENVPLLTTESEDQTVDGPGISGIYSDQTHLFFSGDLNYRTAITTPGQDDHHDFPQPRDNFKDELHYSHLLEKDQLAFQMQQGKTLHGLIEQQINFPPSYKYKLQKDTPVLVDKDMERWAWAEHRWPSWCDRILFSSTEVVAGKYSTLPLFRTSDHRPVSLSVSVPLKKLSESQLSQQAPTRINQDYKSDREAARRKEIAVGIGAYLSLTWEGNALVLGTVLFVIGSLWIRSIS